MNFRIRNYNKSDRSEIINLIKLNTPKFFAKIEEQDLTHYLDNKIEKYFVIELNDNIIGSGGINYQEIDGFQIGIISWDIIHPDFQGKGIGRKLLDYRLEILKNELFINKIIVRTSQHVFKFYENCGFRLKDIVNDYWSEGFHLYLMERE
jgi:ribosomal-protein-alanine N-acetyltransferase